jgi:uncharacterized protein YbbC (DUF1343 family)
VKEFPGQLTAIFSPQHGIWGEQQANMIESANTRLNHLNLPVFSLYSETRRPTAEMLDLVDCLVVDLQDVGTRVYTFAWTLLECLRACAAHLKPLVVLDRPNPLGGDTFEGPMLEPGFVSFVGGATIPLRHGLTMGELARLFVRELAIDVELHCVPMRGWSRDMRYCETGRRWLWPSPNMPTIATVDLYPGQVLLEGCNLSEGRGTTRPFEVVGAPFIDGDRWASELERANIKHVRLLPTRFTPTFDKFAGESCGGLDIQVTDARQLRSINLTVALIASAASLYPDEFRWLDPPYEYEYIKPPIDILFGNAHLRTEVDRSRRNSEWPAVLGRCVLDETRWKERIKPILLY